MVCTLLCPSQRATFRISRVVWSINIAQPCLRVCGETRLLHSEGQLCFADTTCCVSTYSNPVRVIAPPRALRKSSGTAASPRMASHARRLARVRVQTGSTRSRLPFPRIRTDGCGSNVTSSTFRPTNSETRSPATKQISSMARSRMPKRVRGSGTFSMACISSSVEYATSFESVFLSGIAKICRTWSKADGT